MSRSAGVQEAGMRCVLCGGPFRTPTRYDRLTGGLNGLPSLAFQWLEDWRTLPAQVDKRKRGEPPSFYAHRDCIWLIQRKLNIQPEHCKIWPHIQSTTKPTDSMPDRLPPQAYLGIEAVLAPNGSCTSATVLAPSFQAGHAWMLCSPCVCTQNARRILSIWQPKLDSPGHLLSQRLATLKLQHSRSCKVSSPRTPTISAGGASAPFGSAHTPTAPAQPDVWSILLAHPAMHELQIVMLLQLSSKAMSARVSAVAEGRLVLHFSSCSTEGVVSFAAWLHQHAALLRSLQLGVGVCCCKEDEAAADAAITEALAAAATTAPKMALTAFGTTCSKPQLLTRRYQALPCLQYLVALRLPDLPSTHISALPRVLRSLDMTASTLPALGLAAIAQTCPRLREVRLGYSMSPSSSNAGPGLLDRALSGWPVLPLVEMRLTGIQLPQGQKAACVQEPPYMSKEALCQLGKLGTLTRLVFEGCCVDAPVSQVVSMINTLTRSGNCQVDIEPAGVLTVESTAGSRAPRCFVDSTAVLLQKQPGTAAPDTRTSLSRALP